MPRVRVCSTCVDGVQHGQGLAQQGGELGGHCRHCLKPVVLLAVGVLAQEQFKDMQLAGCAAGGVLLMQHARDQWE